MKTIALFGALLALSAGTAFAADWQSGAVSVAVEPILTPRPVQSVVSIAAAFDFHEDNWLSARIGTGGVLLCGVGRDFHKRLLGGSLVGALEGGFTDGHVAADLSAGISRDLGSQWSVVYGLHAGKVAGSDVYPGVYVALQRSWGR